MDGRTEKHPTKQRREQEEAGGASVISNCSNRTQSITSLSNMQIHLLDTVCTRPEQPRVTPELVTQAVQQAAFSRGAVMENANPGTFRWSLIDFIPLVQKGEGWVGCKIHREKLNEPKLKMGQMWKTFMPCFDGFSPS